MAYVVRRPRGRWEIRESYTAPGGPRARTLSSFTVLSPAVMERAAKAARTNFDAERLLKAARRDGVPFERAPQDELARSLLRSLARGSKIRPGLRLLLLDRLAEGETKTRTIDESLADWFGASMEERGAALVDLLGLADRLPKPKRSKLRFPGLSRRRLSA